MNLSYISLFLFIFVASLLRAELGSGIRFPNRVTQPPPNDRADHPLITAVFALGSFWRSEPVFGCVNGVVRTTVGYAGGSKTSPEYRNLGDHAEAVKVEYDTRVIGFRQLLEIFWSSHDSRQVFGQGPDVGNQYRSIIFTNGTEESRLATMSKEKEQAKSRNSVVTTQIQQLGVFYPAEPEHQKFELKQNQFLLQLIGNLPEEELQRSTLASKLNSYSAELCPTKIQKRIDTKIDNIVRKAEDMAVEKLPEEAPAVEKLPEEVPAEEQLLTPAEKAVKEKKPKVVKEKKTKSKRITSHPPYFQMIEEALVALNEKSGSSPYAIAKFVEEKHKAELPPNFKKMLGLQLKNSVSKGKLIKIKASYKLSKSIKKPKAVEKANKKAEKKAIQRRPKRKSVAAVGKPKQPKSIKAPAKKKSNKASS